MATTESACVVENFALANMRYTAAMKNALRIVEKGSVDAMGRFIVGCERCGGKFDLDAAEEEPEMRPAAAPETPGEACLAVTHYSGGNIMPLDRTWFGVYM